MTKKPVEREANSHRRMEQEEDEASAQLAAMPEDDALPCDGQQLKLRQLQASEQAALGAFGKLCMSRVRGYFIICVSLQNGGANYGIL